MKLLSLFCLQTYVLGNLGSSAFASVRRIWLTPEPCFPFPSKQCLRAQGSQSSSQHDMRTLKLLPQLLQLPNPALSLTLDPLISAPSGDASGWSLLALVSTVAAKPHMFYQSLVCVVGRILRRAPRTLSPWDAHTFSQLFNQSLIQVLLQRDFADLIQWPNKLTSRKGGHLEWAWTNQVSP